MRQAGIVADLQCLGKPHAKCEQAVQLKLNFPRVCQALVPGADTAKPIAVFKENPGRFQGRVVQTLEPGDGFPGRQAGAASLRSNSLITTRRPSAALASQLWLCSGSRRFLTSLNWPMTAPGDSSITPRSHFLNRLKLIPDELQFTPAFTISFDGSCATGRPTSSA